ncbi:MAG: 50S ribosomal protein L28 [Bacillota bacterium]
MSRHCEVCGKGMISGNKVSHSNRKTRRVWLPNVRTVRAVVNGTPQRLHVCTRCLRSGKVQRAI